MWTCDRCGAQNTDGEAACASCGAPKSAAAKAGGGRKRKRRAVVLALVLAAAAAIFWLSRPTGKNDAAEPPDRAPQQAVTPAAAGTAEPEEPPAETAAPEETPAETAAPEESPAETAAPEETPAETTAPEEAAAAEPLPCRDWKNIVAIESGSNFIAGLKSDGTVVLESDESAFPDAASDPSSWRQIKKISAGSTYLIGLKKDGTLVVAGDYDAADEISAWRNIKDISACGDAFAAVRSDGRIALPEESSFYGGDLELYSSWTGVDSIKTVATDNGSFLFGFAKNGSLLNEGHRFLDVSSNGWLTAAVREDGSVFFWGYDTPLLQPELIRWTDVKQVIPIDAGAIGLQNSGRVLFACAGRQYEEAGEWEDVSRLILWEFVDYGDRSGLTFLIGIKNDGTVAVTGTLLVDTGALTDVVDVRLYKDCFVGLKKDGTIAAARWSDEEDQAFLETFSAGGRESGTELPPFEHGWLNFCLGGAMYVPDALTAISLPDPNGEMLEYRFADSDTGMELLVTEEWLGADPEENLSLKFEELNESHADAAVKTKDASTVVFSGSSGSDTYDIRVRAQGGAVYTLFFRYPMERAGACRPVVEETARRLLEYRDPEE